MSKKILIACVLVMTMIFSFATMSHAAGTPTLTIGNLSGSAGDEVTVDVVMTNNPGLISLQFYVDFDNTALNITGFEITEDVLPNNSTKKTFETSNTNGQHLISLGDDEAEEDFVDDGVVVSVTFELLKNIAATDSALQPSLGIIRATDDKVLKDYAYNFDWDNITFTFAQETPAVTAKQAWLGYTNYGNGKYLAVAKFEAGSTAYGIKFDNFEFLADGATLNAEDGTPDNIFAIEIQDLDADPSADVTAFAR